MNKVKFEDLLSTGAHFGHVTSKWNPNFKPFILMEKNGVHIINLDETLLYLDKALGFIQILLRKKVSFYSLEQKSKQEISYSRKQIDVQCFTLLKDGWGHTNQLFYYQKKY